MSRKKNNQQISEQEMLRESYLLMKKFSDFKKTYRKSTANLNTSTFWDKTFHKPQSLCEQDGMTKEKISFITSHLQNLNQPIKLLDIGIGQAYLEQDLRKKKVGFNLSTIDISPLSIKRAIKNFNAKGIVGDALDITSYYKRESFDAIVAIEVVEHISPKLIFSFYKKVNNLLKDDGIFIISTPLNEKLKYMKDNPSQHVREYTTNILRAELELSKFKIVRTKTLIAFKRFYFLKKVLARIFPNHWEANNIVIVARKK